MVVEICQQTVKKTNRQTYKQTDIDTLIAILHIPIVGKVIRVSTSTTHCVHSTVATMVKWTSALFN